MKECELNNCLNENSKFEQENKEKNSQNESFLNENSLLQMSNSELEKQIQQNKYNYEEKLQIQM
jgi:hypothetical protein